MATLALRPREDLIGADANDARDDLRERQFPSITGGPHVRGNDVFLLPRQPSGLRYPVPHRRRKALRLATVRRAVEDHRDDAFAASQLFEKQNFLIDVFALRSRWRTQQDQERRRLERLARLPVEGFAGREFLPITKNRAQRVGIGPDKGRAFAKAIIDPEPFKRTMDASRPRVITMAVGEKRGVFVTVHRIHWH